MVRMMTYKKGSIIKEIGSNKLFEVYSQHGTKILCRAINPVYNGLETVHYDSIFDVNDVEFVMDEANQAFNILFEDQDETD